MTSFTNDLRRFPKAFVDAHHHFLDTTTHKHDDGKTFLGRLMPNSVYLSEDYKRDVIDPLEQAGVQFAGSVHVECLPDDGLEEVQWLMETTNGDEDHGHSYIQAIVASCNLAQHTANVDAELQALAAIPHVKGIRWILDCVGKYDGGKTATHVATTRHDGIDYLRGSHGGYDGQTVPAFEDGFSLLEKHNLTFDLQCAPAQLLEASKLFARHPNTKVVIDHLGKPRRLLEDHVAEDNQNAPLDEQELLVWRDGMKKMAENKNVYVKISMLGYAIPGWIGTPERIAYMKSLVREVVQLFGPTRCMVATNFFIDSALSDSGGESTIGPDPAHFIQLIFGFLEDIYSDEDMEFIFCKTAMNFYGIQ
jgi:predicted TIM-barrel fold metal-dependent hydrolase